MFDLFNSMDIDKIKSKMEELESRIKTLESMNSIEYKPPVNEWIEKVNELTDEEFGILTDIKANPNKYKDKNADEFPKKIIDFVYLIAAYVDDPEENRLITEAIRKRQMDSINGFMEGIMTGDVSKILKK